MKSSDLRGASASSARPFDASPITAVVRTSLARPRESAQAVSVQPAVRLSLRATEQVTPLYARNGRLSTPEAGFAASAGESSSSQHIRARVRASVVSEGGLPARAAQVAGAAVVEKTARDAALAEALRLQSGRTSR